MKKFILNTNLIIHASRLNKVDAQNILICGHLKSTDTQTKSTKMDVRYEKLNDNISIYTKPRYLVDNYIFDEGFIYVGILETDWTIYGSDFEYIEELCKRQNIIPIFSKDTKYHEMIYDILSGITFKYTVDFLNHETLFNEYEKFNKLVFEKLSKIADFENDLVWAQDYNFLFITSKFRHSIQSILIFNELFSCIPFYEKLFCNLIECNTLNFNKKEDIKKFEIFAKQFYFDKILNMPKLKFYEKGLDKNFISRNVLAIPEYNKNLIIIPNDSLHHMICIEKYINKYKVSLNLCILDINKKNEESTELLKYINFLKLKTELFIATPRDDSEFYNLLAKCQIGFCEKYNDIFQYLNKHIILASEYDYEKVADEIFKKLHYVQTSDKKIEDVVNYKNSVISSILNKEEIEYKGNQYNLKESDKYLDVKKYEETLNMENRQVVMSSEFIESLDTCESPDWLCQVLNKSVKTLICDYDGTLVSITSNPEDAFMDERTQNVLKALNKHINVVVCSGRSCESIDKFIPKEIEAFAEHCSFRRINGEWHSLNEQTNWDLEYKIANFYYKRTPGSKIEKKKHGFVFHYRDVAEEYGEIQAKQLFNDLSKINENTKTGKKIVELKSGTKSDIFKFYDTDLVVGGDDLTDEDMFDRKKGVTIKVGGGVKSKAEYFVNDVNEFVDFLHFLLDKFEIMESVQVSGQSAQ